MKWVLFLLLPLLVSCRYTISNLSGNVFDFKGVTAESSTSGAIDKDVTVIEIENKFGEIQVRPGEAEDYLWSWDLTVWSTTDEAAEALLERVQLSQTQTDGRATWKLVLPQPPTTELRGVKSNLTFYVPPTVELRLKNRGKVDLQGLAGIVNVRNEHGDIAVTDLAGKVDLDNEHGDITAERIGPARIKSEHGSATVTQVGGDLTLHGEHSELRVEGVTGDFSGSGEHRSIQVYDVAGAVRLEHEHGGVKVVGATGPVRVKSEHGAVEIDADSVDIECSIEHGNTKLVSRSAKLERLKIDTEHGAVHARLPASVERVSIQSEHGRVDSEIPQASGSNVSIRANHSDVTIEILD